MVDILITDVPDATLVMLERSAAARGLSLSEYLRGWLIEQFIPGDVRTRLQVFSEQFSDLGNDDVMDQAWG